MWCFVGEKLALILYCGYRSSKEDNIYKEEKEQMLQEGVITQIHTALSREPGQPKVWILF